MRRSRETPEVNAGSMADIAFLLIIFFIITATIKSDVGISRKLPPMPDKEELEDPKEIPARNLFVVLVNSNNQLLVEGELIDITQLTEKAKEFVANPTNNPELSDKKSKEINLLGEVMVSKGIISLQNDRGTSYETYIAVQNELARAYNELRSELAQQKFGKQYEFLNDEQKKAIRSVYPQRISEAEPKDIENS
jgi:biopolymer transport protein ExbD